MIGLGRILADAREARGIALDDVERETRIARRYLLALEEEDFAAFPAPVQARGFLRVYAQYLGLDAAEMLALFPADPHAEGHDGLVHNNRIFRDTQPRRRFELPTVSFRSPFVLVAAAIAAVVLAGGLVGSLCASRTERANAELVLFSERGEVGSFRVPDVRNEQLAQALATLEDAGIRPLVIEVPSDRVAGGLVIAQSPPPGGIVQRPTDVTLIVSRGRPQ